MRDNFRESELWWSLMRPLSLHVATAAALVHRRCLPRIDERAMRILAAEQHQPTLVRIEWHRMLDTRGRANFLQLLPFAASPLSGVPAHRSVEAAPPCRNSAEPVEARTAADRPLGPGVGDLGPGRALAHCRGVPKDYRPTPARITTLGHARMMAASSSARARSGRRASGSPSSCLLGGF
jgi:hypothetical protein